jgi:hypothetical protein
MMKNIKYIFLFVLVLLMFNRCEDDIMGTEDINYISFEVVSPTVIVEQGGSAETEVSVYTTQKSGSDRTFNVEVVEEGTSANAPSYNIPASITVPANSNVGTLSITCQDNDLGQDPVSVELKIGDSEGLYTGNTVSFTIQKHCTLDINDFIGTYSGDTPWGATQVETTMQGEQLYITGVGVAFLTGYWGEVITSMEALPLNVDMESGDFTIDQALYAITTYNGEEQPPYYLSAHGNLNACSGAMYLYYDFAQPGADISSYVSAVGGGDQSYFTEIISIQ